MIIYTPRLSTGGRRQNPFTPDDDSRIGKLFAAGLTLQDISRAIDRKPWNVGRRLRTLGLLPPTQIQSQKIEDTAGGATCDRCTVRLAATPRPATDGRCCWCTEEGHTS